MMQLTSTIAGSIPANALKVLVVLMLERLPCTKGYLMTVTDMSDKTLAKALDQLALRGMVTHNGGHVYQIANGVQQLPLEARELDESRAEAVDKPVDNSVDNIIDIDPGAFAGEKSRNISDFSDHACMHDSESFNPDLKPENPTCMPDRKNSELETALLAAGFFGDGLDRLRVQPGLTAREVRYHVGKAPSLGAALTRIEKHWRVPDDFEPDGLEAGSERKKRYGGGERFAGIVQT